MSTARWGKKWADVDEDDEEDDGAAADKNKSGFETRPDKDGVKMVIEYIERDGKTYKITKKVKQTTIQKWTNKGIDQRKLMQPFGKALTEDSAQHITRSDAEDVKIESSQKNHTSVVADDSEDKFYAESLKIAESLFKEKKVWTDMKNEERDKVDGAPAAPAAPGVPAEGSLAQMLQNREVSGPTAGGKGGAATGSRYVPPSLRGGAGDGKGGKDGKGDQSQEASLRVFNLSEDVKEGDLQELFGQFGRLQRVYLAKHMDTFLSKGFAFVTYYNREDGEKAIKKLHGHGYDNLILQVQWAKPKV